MTLTEKIFELSAPYDNRYQGKDKKLVFVCSAGLLRSATAANLFAKKGYNTRSCGSEDYALIPLSLNLIAWADEIYFMRAENYISSVDKFHETQLGFKVESAQVLDIPDYYEYNSSKLIQLLEEQVKVNE